MFLRAPPRGGSDHYRQNLTINEKPFKNLVKMNNSAMWPSGNLSPARSGPRRPSRIPRGPPSETIGIPCVSEVPPLESHWRPLSPRCRPYLFRRNLTFSPKTFESHVKMNVLMYIRSCASPSQARSGSWRLPWIPRGAPVSYTHLTLPTICSV